MSKPIRCKELLLAALALTAWSGHADEYRAEAFQGEEYKARAVIKALDRAVLSGELAARVTQLPKRPGTAFVRASCCWVWIVPLPGPGGQGGRREQGGAF
ncbi:hypothetical protein MBH78_17595 [Oceanimonas sp. NS1]|nr:hypothetical protein [Oceanimonas sp. NS1]